MLLRHLSRHPAGAYKRCGTEDYITVQGTSIHVPWYRYVMMAQIITNYVEQDDRAHLETVLKGG